MRRFCFFVCFLGITSLACNLSSAQVVPTAAATQSSLAVVPTSSTVKPTAPVVPTDAVVSATAAPNPTSCAVQTSWPVYVVASGDTLSTIAARTGSAVNDLLLANCLSNPDAISSGQQLRVPRLPATSQPSTASIGYFSISPSALTPGKPDLLVLQPGANVTLRLEGLQNVTSVQFVIPPPGWAGNGFQKTSPMRVLNGVSEYTLTLPVDKPGADFYFHAEAQTADGHVLMSNIIHAGIAPDGASIGQLSISPSSPTPGHPEVAVVSPGATVTLRIDGLRNVSSVQFVIPPPGWNGNGFDKTDPLPIQNGVAEYTFTVPTDKPRLQFNFTAEVVGNHGEHLIGGPLTVMIAEN